MKNYMTVLLVTILFQFAPCANLAAQDDVAQTRYIKAGRLLDPVSGKVTRDAVISVQGERISGVGGKETVIPEGAEVVDLSNAFVLPGVMDMHTHLMGFVDPGYFNQYFVSPHRAVIGGVVHAKETLMAGFTTVRNVGAADYQDVALRDSINDGEVPGPRMAVSGPALGMTGGHCDNSSLNHTFNERADGVADGPWAVRQMVRKNIKYGADLIKFCATGGVFSKGDAVGSTQYTLEEMKAIVDEAHMHGRKVAAHAHGTEGIERAIEAGVDSVEHCSFLDDEAIRMAKKNGTWLSMDIYNTEYTLSEGAANGVPQENLDKEREVGTRQRESFSMAVKAGAKMVFGSDAGVYPHGDNGKQFARMVQFGMTPLQAIQAATVNSAELLGWQDRVGRIEPGYYADLIAVDGDPLEDISELE
ncbi:MAG: amidohydrolase family protein, partial [Lysobacterales bacterium]